MKKTLTTALAIAAIATSVSAQTTTTTTQTTTKKTTTIHHKHHKNHTPVVAGAKPVNAGYREIHVGDPTVVYHQIGTAGSQRDNTIVPMYHESIQSVKPYEIRYDYSI